MIDINTKKDVGVSTSRPSQVSGSRIAYAQRIDNSDTTPIQRQISCNNQNDKKSRVNTNIYSI